MRFVYRVEVEVERDEGKFESRETIGAEIEESLTNADPGTISGDNGGAYSVQSFEVTDISEEEAAAWRKKRDEARAAARKATRR